MKKTKNLLSVIMATIMCISSFSVCNISAYAAGWIDMAQTVELDTVFSESYSKASDAYKDNGYADAFKFNVSENGNVTIHIETENRNYFYWPTIYLYNENDTSSYIAQYYKPSHEFDSGRGIYFSDNTISLKKGNYFLVYNYGDGYMASYLNGTYDIQLKYNPVFPNANISKIKTGKKLLKIYYSKCSNVSGYQLQYSTNKNMKSAKTINLSSSSSLKTIKSLKSKKNYYVRIRTYKTVNINGSNKTYYGKWSPKKAVKTK